MMQPDELCAALFVLIGGLYCCKVVYFDLVGGRKSEEIRRRRDELTQSYNGIVKALQREIKEVRHSPAMQAELSFHGQARHFQQFMSDVARTPSRILGVDADDTVCLEPFRQFTRFWLKVFEQCSLNPRKEPRRVVTEAQLRNCNAIKEVAELVGSRMAAHPIMWMSGTSDLLDETNRLTNRENAASRSRRSARGHGSCCCCCCFLCPWVRCEWALCCSFRRRKGEEDPFPSECNAACLSVRLMSWAHARLLAIVLFGACLSAFLFARSKLLPAIAAAVVDCFLVILLFWMEEVDTRCRLEAQVKVLKEQSANLEASLADVSTKYTKMGALSTLWQYRTLPHLELFRNVTEHLLEASSAEKVSFLLGVAEACEKLEHAMGDIWMWVGSGAFPEKQLRLIGDQLQATVNGMEHYDTKRHPQKSHRELVLDRLNNVFSFLAVRVIACHNLLNKGRALFGEVSDPYVIVRVGKDENRTTRTRTIQDNLNPRWFDDDEPPGECDFLPVVCHEHIVELEVWDENFRAEDVAMGYLNADFKSGAPGIWHRKRMRLYSFRTHQLRGHGEIEFEFYYANCLMLLHTSWDRSAAQSTQAHLVQPVSTDRSTSL